MLCNTFNTKVDPVVKVLHRETLQKLMLLSTTKADSIPGGKAMEALMFSIYYASITGILRKSALRIYTRQDNTSGSDTEMTGNVL